MSHLTDTNGDTRPRAAQACSACRKQKKGCDKLFPTCSLCERLLRPCQYEADLPTKPAPELAYEALVQRLTNLEHEMSQHRTVLSTHIDAQTRLNQSLLRPLASVNTPESLQQDDPPGFPAAFFLDVEAFKRCKGEVPRPQTSIPSYILKILGSPFEIRAIISAYFSSISTWLAIISKHKIHQEISAAPEALAPDTTLLILSMKLLNESAIHNGPQHPRSPLYSLSKEFFAAVESRGIASIRLLQAGVLIAIYEMGHAIYPEAYVTIGRVGRLGQAIGLHDAVGIPQLRLEPDDWDEMEERRRTWWAVYILDRNINIGNPSRSFALAEVSRREYLPVDDQAWSDGAVVESEPLLVSSAPSIDVAPTARLCQASHLLSLVLTHINDRVSDPQSRLEEAKHLSRALHSLVHFLRKDVTQDPMRFCVPKSVCYSALMTLYEYNLASAQNDTSISAEQELHELSKQEMQSLIPIVAEYAAKISSTLPFNSDRVSPLIIHSLYKMASWLSRTTLRDEYLEALESMELCLRKLDGRWKVAGEYLKILDASMAQSLTN